VTKRATQRINKDEIENNPSRGKARDVAHRLNKLKWIRRELNAARERSHSRERAARAGGTRTCRRAGRESPRHGRGQGRGQGAGHGARGQGAGLAGAGARGRTRGGRLAGAGAGVARRRAGRGGRGRAGARRGRRRGGEGEREGEGGEGKTHLRGSKFRRSRLQTLGHHGEREVEEGEGGCCTGILNERGRGGGGRMGRWAGAPGARGPGQTGPGWAGLGWATSRIKTHDTHDPQTGSNRESKSETERDEHATSNKEMRFSMLQHP
jgi:hypothetical protein